jgi:asparagine synthase (glutamine-hydrolysing)
MCGIVAQLSFDRGVDAADLARALDALAHRGPDGRGVWVSADRTVGLAHARLATRDVAGSPQPVASEDGAVVASVNGEIYATAPLRAELEGAGHRIATHGDSELLVHAWEQWGPDMLRRLRGEFAFVLWDARARCLFAARDAFGVKPLAWAEHDGRLSIASQVRGLFALGLRPAWDRAALHQSASLQYARPDATLFAGARELRAGHWLMAREGRVEVRPYTDLDYPDLRRGAPEPVDARDAADRLRATLDDAVRVRLEADVPCAFQLSGGIDSSAVLASAARQSARTLDAFCVSFTDGGAYDETARAEAIARHLGARLHPVRVTDRDAADSFADAVVHAEGACINAHAAAKLRLSAAVRDAGFKVVLTGEGADEILFGYAHLQADCDGALPRAGAHAASAGLMLPDGDGIPCDAVERALGFVPTWITAKAALGKRVLALARDEWLAEHRAANPARELLAPFDVEARLGGRGRAEQAAYLWTRLALEGYILRALGDALEMANGVEGRLPFLDRDVVALAASLPTRAKIGHDARPASNASDANDAGGATKRVLRDAVRDRLPTEVARREKHPFLAPPMGARMLEVARDVLAGPALRGQPLFDPARVLALLDALPSMPPDRRKAMDPVVFFVLSIAVLQSRFGVGS